MKWEDTHPGREEDHETVYLIQAMICLLDKSHKLVAKEVYLTPKAVT